MSSARLSRFSACALHVVALAAALGLSGSRASADPISHGKALVEANCARCHAIGRTDKSSHPDAPAFRVLSQRYPIADLEEALLQIAIYAGIPAANAAFQIAREEMGKS